MKLADGTNVLVTGANGFLGKHLVRKLGELFPRTSLITVHHSNDATRGADLTRTDHTSNVFDNIVRSQRKLDYVIHLAGGGGGLAGNIAAPARIFHDNTVMGLNVLEAARQVGCRKVLSVVTSCAYPAQRQTCPEDEFFDGPPHETVACHGYAKRNIQLASRFYRQQYGLNAVCVALTTLYGPGAPTDPLKTKVLDALVKKFVDAVYDGASEVVLWGTGKPLREFLYVEDAATLILKAFETYDDSTVPLNIGSGQEMSVKDLAQLVADVVGFKGVIRWDTSRPDGQYRKRLDLTRMRSILGKAQFTSLEDGIGRTVVYYRSLRSGTKC